MRVDKALNNNSSKEMLTVCNGRTYAYPQENPVYGGSLTYSQLCHAPLRRQNTGLHYLSAPREEVQGSPHSWTIDDSRCRDMPVVCSDLTYARTGIMLKVTGAWAMVATVWTLPRVNAEEKPFIRLVVEDGPILYGPCLLQHPFKAGSTWFDNLGCRSRTGGSILMCWRTLPRVTGKEGLC